MYSKHSISVGSTLAWLTVEEVRDISQVTFRGQELRKLLQGRSEDYIVWCLSVQKD